jgi:hypothetical protein
MSWAYQPFRRSDSNSRLVISSFETGRGVDKKTLMNYRHVTPKSAGNSRMFVDYSGQLVSGYRLLKKSFHIVREAK